MVTAPAGYGKTALLVQWRRRLLESGRACGWVTVDAADSSAVDVLSRM